MWSPGLLEAEAQGLQVKVSLGYRVSFVEKYNMVVTQLSRRAAFKIKPKFKKLVIQHGKYRLVVPQYSDYVNVQRG